MEWLNKMTSQNICKCGKPYIEHQECFSYDSKALKNPCKKFEPVHTHGESHHAGRDSDALHVHKNPRKENIK